MSEPTPAPPPNRLLLPLIALSLLCVAEAVAIAFLLGRGDRAPSSAAASAARTAEQADASPSPSAPPTDPAKSAQKPPAAPSIARGKVGQRVDSAGIAMTVVTVSNEPRFKELFTPGANDKFVDVEILIENKTHRGFAYYSNQYTLKDSADRPFSSTALGAGQPAIGWGTLVPGDQVRGHLAFVVPRDATGLTLTYPVSDGPKDAHAIQIDLGQ